ncbi:MAG: rRNA maturation RNase YbeY [Candidatus Liberibacter europaeus]|uniref:Endoribonuclease YbeY n=1 Tax=Candidatus Liberibacter europaeus TaxID=744859 RepID=A0A2T4VYT4_9HYPH|nr:rRNA maturation RNase YbeY [Candidatus Liberibacter europaeus]PTL86931.1 MAG: rRNA maturation RNase YbeY [Candidatus Liberibacter europaeus]
MNSPRIDLRIAVKSDYWRQDIDLNALCENIFSRTVFYLISNKVKYFLDFIEISLVFTDSNGIKKINTECRGINKPTNVLSFPSFFALSGDCLGPMLGDIILAYEVIKKETNLLEKKFEDHLTHMIVHGFLHLLGYDHVDDDDACVMEELEISILADLGVNDPYAY